MDGDPEVSCIDTDRAPRPFGDAYCQAVVAGGFVFVSGQGGFLADGTLVPGGAAAEARQALRNIEAILAKAGVGLSAVVRTTIYYSDLRDAAAVNEVYKGVFKDPVKPARMVYQVASPPVAGTRVWIDAQAVIRP
jgi:2-iminobutanoate/2-iminopropanoate deaminase